MRRVIVRGELSQDGRSVRDSNHRVYVCEIYIQESVAELLVTG